MTGRATNQLSFLGGAVRARKGPLILLVPHHEPYEVKSEKKKKRLVHVRTEPRGLPRCVQYHYPLHHLRTGPWGYKTLSYRYIYMCVCVCVLIYQQRVLYFPLSITQRVRSRIRASVVRRDGSSAIPSAGSAQRERRRPIHAPVR